MDMNTNGRTNGARNRNHSQAIFWWAKTAYQYEPLEQSELEYLDELARLRLRMFDGKVRSEEKQDEIEARHDGVVRILGVFHDIDITFPREKG